MSEARNQAELLSEGYLDQLGTSGVDYTEAGELPVSARLLVLAAASFVQRVQQNLNDLGKVSTGTLATDITQGEIETGGGKVSITVGYPAQSPGAKYYDFVNEGVQGVESKQPASSPYSFKNLATPPVMVNAIQGWIQTNNIRSQQETQTRDLSALQSKRKDIQDVSGGSASKSLARAIARSIKRRGLPRTGFFDDAAQFAFGQEFLDTLAKAVGADIRIAIRQANRPTGG